MKGRAMTENPKLPLAFLLLFFAAGAQAQVPVDEDGNPVGTYQAGEFDDDEYVDAADEVPLLSPVELEDLVGPVALYPDDLLAIVLPASTYPLQIVQAARFLEALETDSSLKPDEEWDDSIVALLNYPDVVRMMDEDIDWTWKLGEAVLAQQNDVIAAVESFRDRAYAAGNLKTDEHQEVSYEDGTIEIVPVSEEIIHVPYYQPEEVLVSQTRRVYHYYPDPYPVYYYPYPVGHRFRNDYFWGVTTAFSIGWSNHYLHVYHPSYWGHPYYGHYYYGNYYRRPSITVFNTWYVNNSYNRTRNHYRDGDYWRPRTRAGSRPEVQRVRNLHYSTNGSRNSRDFTVTRRERIRAGDDRPMERDRVRTSNRSPAISFRERPDSSARPATGRTTTNRVRTRDVNTRTTRPQATQPSSGRVTAPTRTSRQSTSPARTSRPTTTTRRTTAPTRTSQPISAPRRVTAPAASRPTAPAVQRPASVPRATAPASRQRVAPPRANPSTTQRRTSPRTSAPSVQRQSAPRATAPAVQQRAPATTRSGSRASSRGTATRTERSASSRRRTRTNRD